MTSRRRRPEGVQYRRRSDGTIGYRVPWREGGVRDGAQRSRTFELVEQAVSFRGALVTNGYRDPYDDPEWVARLGLVAQPSTARTFEQAAREYLETLVDVTERTVAEYRRDLDTHVYPAVAVLPNGDTVGPFRRVMVDRFDTETVQAWVSLMRKKTHGGKAQRKYSPKTITNLHGSVIAPVFEFAIDRGYISSNPAGAAARAQGPIGEEPPRPRHRRDVGLDRLCVRA